MFFPQPMTDDERLAAELVAEVDEGDKRAIENLLAAGASVQGRPGLSMPPLIMSVQQGNLEMVEFLIAKGADVNAPAPCDPMSVLLSGTGKAPLPTGLRALHFAADSGSIGAVRLLLRAGADPLLKDENGRSALFMACLRNTAGDEVEIMSTLLEAGADAGLADIHGFMPLHYAAGNGRDSVVDVFLSEAPGVLNRTVCEGGPTPLYCAAEEGHASTVSRLLSAGAQQKRRSETGECCPLAVAVQKGHAGVVRLLIDRGMEAIGGMSMVLPVALDIAIKKGQRGILGMIFRAGGEEILRETARRCFVSNRHMSLLHVAAGFAILPSVTALLSAGVDEREVDREGRLARNIVGSLSNPDTEKCHRHPAMVPAVLRALERGPAFRARSWAWPSLRAVADAAAADVAAASAPKATKPSPARNFTIDMQLFRPRDRSSVVGLFGRYANKN